MEPITIWREDGGRLIERPDDGTGGMLPGGAWTKLRALPRAEYDALAAEAADARTLRAERDSLVKERDEAVKDCGRLDRALRDEAAKADAATARADAASERLARAEALLREARESVVRDDTRNSEEMDALVARIDAHLEGK